MLRRGGLLFLAVAACGAEQTPDVVVEPPPTLPLPPPATGQPVKLAVVALDGKPITSASLRGRYTVIVLGASFDTASQAQARFLKTIVQRHVPRVNALMLMLEPIDNRLIVEAFAAALELPYPVAFADDSTVAGHGAFPGLHHVPSVVVLDREGRERWRHVGLVEPPEIDDQLRQLEGAERSKK